ncbi:MAG: transcription repressor NadR [Oscillospiraceae bacterium]|jgi:transcriptional regulator of NAD metabolism
MNTKERRAALAKILHQVSDPVTATTLAEQFGVSRQIIVGDIALLRAKGIRILSTPRGYLTQRDHEGERYTIACQHDAAGLKEELYTIVDEGGCISDVIVEHPIYGQIVGTLHLHSRFDIDRFCAQLQETQASPLSLLTEGIHLHTILCPDENTYQRILVALREKQFLVE